MKYLLKMPFSTLGSETFLRARLSVGLSVKISYMGGKFHFHAPFGGLVFSQYKAHLFENYITIPTNLGILSGGSPGVLTGDGGWRGTGAGAAAAAATAGVDVGCISVVAVLT